MHFYHILCRKAQPKVGSDLSRFNSLTTRNGFVGSRPNRCPVLVQYRTSAPSRANLHPFGYVYPEPRRRAQGRFSPARRGTFRMTTRTYTPSLSLSTLALYASTVHLRCTQVLCTCAVLKYCAVATCSTCDSVWFGADAPVLRPHRTKRFLPLLPTPVLSPSKGLIANRSP